MTAVLLIDNQRLIRAGLRLLLERESDIAIVGDTPCGEEGLKAHAQLSPDIVIMSSFAPETCGLTVIRRMLQRDAKTKIIILTSSQSTHFVERMLRIGVRGIMSKSVEPRELFDGIRTIVAGRQYLEGNLAQQVLLRRSDGDSRLDALSSREFEVFCLLARGMRCQDIAELLYISEKTVAVHRSNIMNKLALKNVASLVLMALEHGVLSIERNSDLLDPVDGEPAG